MAPFRAPSNLSSVDASEMSTLSSPRIPRFDTPHLSAVLPPPSRASTSASSGRSPRAEDYLKRMQQVGQAHQQQLQILEKHWDLMQDFEKGKLESFKQEHAVLKEKQLRLLKEVETQLQELSGSPAPEKQQEVTFGEAPQPQPVPTATRAPPRKVRVETGRALVLGAAGLLGREIFKNCRGKWELRGICSSRCPKSLRDGSSWAGEVVDGPILEVLEGQLKDFKSQVVLHLCGTEIGQKDGLDGANSVGFKTFAADTRAIASACEAHGVWLIHLSSDAVFNGLASPYTVNAEPTPVTDDGVASLQAEQEVLSHARTAVLRVPRCLYGPVEDLQESPVTGVLDQLRYGRVDFNIQPLYPTFVGDVASLLMLLLLQHLVDSGELRGIYHWQGPDQLSELQIAKVWCEATGDTLAASLRPRPSKCQADRALDISRLARSFPLTPTSFKEGLRKCLAPGELGDRLGRTVAGTLHWAAGCRAVGEQVV